MFEKTNTPQYSSFRHNYQLSPSADCCRFEIPMDIVCLSTMDPLSYISEYCKVCPRRQNLYSTLFNRHRSLKTNTINKDHILSAVCQLRGVSKAFTENILKLLDVCRDICMAEYVAICAFIERVVCVNEAYVINY